MATDAPLGVQDWLDRMLAADPVDINMVAINALRSGIALERVVCELHRLTEGWTGMARHLRETETDWRSKHPHAGPLHTTGDLRPWTQADAPPASPWETSQCRSCGAPVIWAITAREKRMPVDLEPNPAGNLILVAPADVIDAPRVIVLHTEAELAEVDVAQLRTSHFATCPNADAHRRPR